MGVKDLFELHIYTMGSRSYARKVWERRSLAVTCVLCRVVLCAHQCSDAFHSSPSYPSSRYAGGADNRPRAEALPGEYRLSR